MRRITILFTLVVSAFLISAQTTRYSKVKVFANENELTQIAEAGIDVTEGIFKPGVFLISDFSEAELEKISALKLNYEILIEDVVKYYRDRNIGLSTHPDDYKDAGDYEVPENFEFGSMSGHATYDEINAVLDEMVSLFPNLVTSKESLGQTIEGREIWMVKISDNPGVNESEPEVLYTALHHAREPVGAMQMLFYMWYLLENYDNDPFIQTLVNNTEMYFIPVVNPDGYVYNEITNPNGGGMWRKNRRITGEPGCDGVDLNRNYDYMWGLNNSGSSGDPCEETYRGEAAFSEPETAAIRDFCESHEIVNALNYHTYSNLLLYPWGYNADPCPDDAIFNAHATLMTQDNHYTYGPGYTTIYETNGGSDDWMYGEQSTKGKIFAFTPELGGDGDGFWCPIDRIIPISQVNMIQNLLLAAFAGPYATVTDLSPTITNQISGYIDFNITRLGLAEGSYTVSIDPIGSWVVSTGDPVIFTDLEVMETQTASISWALDPSIVNGTQFQFALSVDNGSYILTDTLTKIYGTSVNLFEDDCNSLANWTTTYWGLTSTQYHSAPQSITDSPGGNYPNNANRVVTLTSPIEINNAIYAELNFWARWEIETGYDYAQVLISTNNGTTWTPLAGNYTVTGSEYQAAGEPVYDGFQTSWVKEEINITQYIGNPVKFRFKLKADGNVTEDGFYFDDLAITIVESPNTGINIPGYQQEIWISDPAPNPAGNRVSFDLNLPAETDNASFIIYNGAGQKVYSIILDKNQSRLSIPVLDFEPGIYYYWLEGDKIRSMAKKLIII
ncbi:MAG: hypothetical protein FJY07_03080 [Bacteroidetes bacterium]|nr:hypothetical protein [Bacteroidota bacterium]